MNESVDGRDEPGHDEGCFARRLAKIEIEIAVIKWMLGVLIAGVASLVVKAFA